MATMGATIPATPGTSRTRARAVRSLAMAVVAVFAAAVLAGLAMTSGLLSSGWIAGSGSLSRVGDHERVHRIGDDVQTSFGIVAVEFIRELDGLSNRALAGTAHGVPGLIDTEHVQVQAALAVTNRLPEPLRFHVDQVRLRISEPGKQTVVQAPVGGDLPDTRVLSNAGIEGHLDFVVPRRGARLTLQFRDPASSAPVLVDLGKTDFGPSYGGSSGHHH